VIPTLAFTLGVLLGAAAAEAAEWNAVRPGESSQAAVREQFGQPTKVSSQKIEGYDSAQWVYEGGQAPRGMVRVTVEFGILGPQGYRADVVRVLRLEPRPGIFPRATIVMGWGLPERTGKEKDADVFFYESGLLVHFDKDGRHAQTMTFMPPQQPAAGSGPPPR
jgi:hypothetical protein